MRFKLVSIGLAVGKKVRLRAAVHFCDDNWLNRECFRDDNFFSLFMHVLCFLVDLGGKLESFDCGRDRVTFNFEKILGPGFDEDGLQTFDEGSGIVAVFGVVIGVKWGDPCRQFNALVVCRANCGTCGRGSLRVRGHTGPGG